MAERSTAAVDVADESSGADGEEKPSSTAAERATADGSTDHDGDDGAAAEAARTADTEGTGTQPADTVTPVSRPPQPPELHSGHKLARRYRLEECVTRLDGFSSWRAVDEKLRRAVGVHLLAADHPRARPVLAAARSAALLGDPRFVQVLDAVEEGDLVYVVHEWLPDATSLATLLASGPLPTHEAYQLVSQVAQAMAAAHREGLAHLRLTPGCVLRTAAGQYRIRGLAVNAALRGITSDHPQRTDTEAIGALLYASLTQRWPYSEDAYGLSGMAELTGDSLVPPDQVRAGVHRGLSELAMRAMVNNGATASRQEQPCATPEELTKAIAALPRIRPPEPDFAAPPPYQRPAFRQGYGAPATRPPAGPVGPPTVAAPPAPPALPGRTGKLLKWSVSALLIAALGLGSWQLADTLMKGDPSVTGSQQSRIEQQKQPEAAPTGRPIEISLVKDFDPSGSDGSENGDDVSAVLDSDPSTYWQTSSYLGNPKFGGLKEGVGLILDLGKSQQVSSVRVDFRGTTSVDFLAAGKGTTEMPSSLSDFSRVSSGSGTEVELRAKKPIETRYVLVWLTELPPAEGGNYRGRITEVEVLS